MRSGDTVLLLVTHTHTHTRIWSFHDVDTMFCITPTNHLTAASVCFCFFKWGHFWLPPVWTSTAGSSSIKIYNRVNHCSFLCPLKNFFSPPMLHQQAVGQPGSNQSVKKVSTHTHACTHTNTFAPTHTVITTSVGYKGKNDVDHYHANQYGSSIMSLMAQTDRLETLSIGHCSSFFICTSLLISTYSTAEVMRSQLGWTLFH